MEPGKAAGGVAVANLIDLGSEAPSQPPPPATADPFSPASTNDIHLRLAGMSKLDHLSPVTLCLVWSTGHFIYFILFTNLLP